MFRNQVYSYGLLLVVEGRNYATLKALKLGVKISGLHWGKISKIYIFFLNDLAVLASSIKTAVIIKIKREKESGDRTVKEIFIILFYIIYLHSYLSL